MTVFRGLCKFFICFISRRLDLYTFSFLSSSMLLWCWCFCHKKHFPIVFGSREWKQSRTKALYSASVPSCSPFPWTKYDVSSCGSRRSWISNDYVHHLLCLCSLSFSHLDLVFSLSFCRSDQLSSEDVEWKTIQCPIYLERFISINNTMPARQFLNSSYVNFGGSGGCWLYICVAISPCIAELGFVWYREWELFVIVLKLCLSASLLLQPSYPSLPFFGMYPLYGNKGFCHKPSISSSVWLNLALQMSGLEVERNPISAYGKLIHLGVDREALI